MDEKEISLGSGGLILFENLPNNEPSLKKNHWFRLTLDRVKYIHSAVQQFYSFFIQQDHHEISQYHARRSAISAIISRNHSHHIGSHVIPRTSVDLLREKLENLKKKGKLKDNSDFIKIIDILKTRLDEYIQKKADFMAEVATEPLISTKNISFLREIIHFFATNTLIMDNLCDNEGLGYPKSDDNYDNLGCNLKIIPMNNGEELDAKFTCPICNDKDFKLSNYPYTSTCSEHSNLDNEGDFKGELLWAGGEIKGQNGSSKTFDDVEIAVPGPLGEYAIYCFFENFIRNSAKHNRDNLQDGLKIYINVSEIKNGDINSNKGFFKEADKHEFYKVEVWDNVTNPNDTRTIKDETGKEKEKSLVDFLNCCIQQDIINEDGSIRKGAWGVTEMKIMATLLRGSDNFLKMQENLRIEKTNKCGKDRLVYIFKLMRPKKVALLCNLTEEEKNNRKADREKGIWWFTSIDEYKKHIQSGESIAAFEFVVIDNAFLSQEIGNLKNIEQKRFSALLPFRVFEGDGSLIKGAMKVNKDFVKKLKNNKEADSIYQSVWEKWIEQMDNTINIP